MSIDKKKKFCGEHIKFLGVNEVSMRWYDVVGSFLKALTNGAWLDLLLHPNIRPGFTN